MPLRPATAAWFELLIARDELPQALHSLAESAQVELQCRSDVTATHLLPALRSVLDEYRRLAQRYSHYWPAPAPSSRRQQGAPEAIAAKALQHLREWVKQADKPIGRLQKIEHELLQLGLLRQILADEQLELPDLRMFAVAGPTLASRIYLFPGPHCVWQAPPAVLAMQLARDQQAYVVAVGPAEQIAELDEFASSQQARRLELPAGIPAKRAAALAHIDTASEAFARQSHALSNALQRLHEQHELPATLADLHFIEWLVQHVPELESTEQFAWITGWTSDPSGARLRAALKNSTPNYLLRLPDPPRELVQPVILRNPPWIRPFEVFARLLGMPGASEADPSRVVALLAPLMFGYMFGDVGQGAVLIATGLVLRRRYPAISLLIPGGAAAMLFGLLFGSVFTNEQLLAPLWLRPMEQPLTLLGASLIFGVLMIFLGLMLDALQHYWSGQAARWWATRAGLVTCYLAIVATAFDIRSLWALPAGLAWYWTGSAFVATTQRTSSLLRAMGESVETLLQLAVNTISFIRVGAFALAHAGLSAVVSELAHGIEAAPLHWLALVLGNLVIIVIEGVVVGIQTTRLVLFEFFIRFLRGAGRPFLPLPATSAETLHSVKKHS